MKNTILLLLLLTCANNYAQRNLLQELTYDDCQNSEVFQKIKNNTKILKYTAADGSVLKLGDTLVLGAPTGSLTNTTAIGGGGNNIGGGKARSKTESSFQTIIMGRPGGFGNVMSAMGGESAATAGLNMQGEIVVISEMKVTHKGSKKKPLQLIILLGEVNGRAFGINKYMSVVDYEKSVLQGEIRSINAPMTRDEAIAKLKESKELLDLEMMTQEEYDKIKEELSPIIKGEN